MPKTRHASCLASTWNHRERTSDVSLLPNKLISSLHSDNSGHVHTGSSRQGPCTNKVLSSLHHTFWFGLAVFYPILFSRPSQATST